MYKKLHLNYDCNCFQFAKDILLLRSLLACAMSGDVGLTAVGMYGAQPKLIYLGIERGQKLTTIKYMSSLYDMTLVIVPADFAV